MQDMGLENVAHIDGGSRRMESGGATYGGERKKIGEQWKNRVGIESRPVFKNDM